MVYTYFTMLFVFFWPLFPFFMYEDLYDSFCFVHSHLLVILGGLKASISDHIHLIQSGSACRLSLGSWTRFFWRKMPFTLYKPLKGRSFQDKPPSIQRVRLTIKACMDPDQHSQSGFVSTEPTESGSKTLFKTDFFLNFNILYTVQYSRSLYSHSKTLTSTSSCSYTPNLVFVLVSSLL